MTIDLKQHEKAAYQPLAARMRPSALDQYQGQLHLLSKGKPLYESIVQGNLHSMVLWGPAGSGKTSLANVLAERCNANFKQLSAVLSGVKDIKAVLDEAEFYRQQSNLQTVLFVDEVHRFNKAQQDVFLPFIEDGRIIFIGATTENPSFELNNALLSRCQVYKLTPLSASDVDVLVRRCLESDALSKDDLTISLSDTQIERIAIMSNGDARRALNLIECIMTHLHQMGEATLSDDSLNDILSDQGIVFDKKGDVFYEQISALHKSVRGSDPDASLYWLARMLTGGCDPLYIARRVVRMASEDIGNADPRALQLTLHAWDVQERLGSPEGHLAIAQAVVYLACAAKSNAVYKAFNQVMRDVSQQPQYEVPMHLRNAPTQLMKDEQYGAEYRYAHDEDNGFASGENYFPEALKNTTYYHPVERGLEIKIKQKLETLNALNQASDQKRYP